MSVMTEDYVMPFPIPYLEKRSIHRYLMKIAAVLEDLRSQIDGRDSKQIHDIIQ